MYTQGVSTHRHKTPKLKVISGKLVNQGLLTKHSDTLLLKMFNEYVTETLTDVVHPNQCNPKPITFKALPARNNRSYAHEKSAQKRQNLKLHLAECKQNNSGAENSASSESEEHRDVYV